MNRYRGTNAVPSKATSQTLCQSYECKALAQERPYSKRPSRTQQLANPKLVPKLTSDIPNDLLRKEGVADEELAKKEADRVSKRRLDDDDPMGSPRKRSQSVSSYTSNSVSTISTNRSRSSSPNLAARENHTGNSQFLSHLKVDRKRRRSRSSSMSYTSESPHDRRQSDHDLTATASRDVPRKQPQNREADGQRRRRARSRSMSYTSETSPKKNGRGLSRDGDRSKRRRHSSRSPLGRGRDSFGNRGSRRTRSLSKSRDRSEVNRNRKSMTPGLSRPGDTQRPSIDRGHSNYSRDNDRYGSSARDQDKHITGSGPPANAPFTRKERSLSPFSKRLALTHAMNTGR